MKRIIAFLACLSSALNSTSLNAAMPTAQFLLLGQGARSEAMGESVVSNAFDNSASYWNPAAAVYLKHPELGFNGTMLPGEVSNSFFSFIYPLKALSFGISVLTERVSIDTADTNAVRIGDANIVNENVCFLAALKIFKKLSIGATAGSVSMPSGDNANASAATVRIGGLYRGDKYNFGASLSNIGPGLRFYDGGTNEPQPVVLRAGASRSYFKNNNLMLSASIEKVVNDKTDAALGLGTEYYVGDNFAIRGGLKIQDENTRPSLGLGVNYGWFFIDLAHTFPVSNLEGTNMTRISLSVKIGRGREEGDTSGRAAVKRNEAVARKPGETINLAIADFSGKNVSQADASILTDFIRTELVTMGSYNVVEKANMDKILAEAAFQQTGCTTSDCAVKIGKILNVQQMLVGSLSKLMDTYYITINIVDVETGKIIASFDQEAGSAKELKNASRILAEKIGGAR
ncbi:MAG: hypothetical protein A2314_00110 [Elusimicrobia bacterium RIFOXYB2_FULL_50_12]|nr:MAG: hypothetical protein A2314_00110 [Elusimicrobia bacterium RIFOXYB2_FULL_50_12]